MVSLGPSFHVVRCCHGSAGGDWRNRCRFEPRHGNPDERDSCFHVGDCIGAGEAPRTVGDQSPELGVSGALGHLYGTVMVLLFRALQMGPASSVAPVDKLSVVLVILGAWLLLGEHLTPLKIVGGSLVTLGAVILAFA